MKSATLSSLICRFTARRAPGSTTTSALSTRIEVCPPELWPSSTGWRGTLRRWTAPTLETLTDAEGARHRLTRVKDEFIAQLTDIDDPQAGQVCERIARARSLRELWHLRSPLFSLVACHLSQSEANQRLERLNRHFATRIARVGF